MVRVHAEIELARDQELLESAERAGMATFRTWATPAPTVVVGRGVRVADEVDETFCRDAGIAIVRRTSGGRSVWIGPGTLQWTFALPFALSDELESIPGAKRFCNRMLLAALATNGSRPSALGEDPSGDLVVAGRKCGGVALRRRRTAVLVHGTLLLDVDVALIARALHHPVREPAYRAGRTHADFLTNLGVIDEPEFERTVRASLASIG